MATDQVPEEKAREVKSQELILGKNLSNRLELAQKTNLEPHIREAQIAAEAEFNLLKRGYQEWVKKHINAMSISDDPDDQTDEIMQIRSAIWTNGQDMKNVSLSKAFFGEDSDVLDFSDGEIFISDLNDPDHAELTFNLGDFLPKVDLSLKGRTQSLIYTNGGIRHSWPGEGGRLQVKKEPPPTEHPDILDYSRKVLDFLNRATVSSQALPGNNLA